MGVGDIRRVTFQKYIFENVDSDQFMIFLLLPDQWFPRSELLTALFVFRYTLCLFNMRLLCLLMCQFGYNSKNRTSG